MASIGSLFAFPIFKNNDKVFLSYFSVIFSTFGIYNYRSNNKKIIELKKYKLFLDLVDHLDDINDSEFLKCIEFEKLYQKQFDINTLDEYTYGDVKTIYKSYKLKQKK